MGMPSQPSNPYPSLLDTSMLISLSLLTTAGDVREEPQRNLTTSPTAAQAQVTTTFCVLGLSICSYYLLCVGLRDLLFRPSPVSLFNLLFSVFTTVSANNNHRQLRGSENSRWAELPANADCPIIGKSEVDRWTKSEEASLLATGLVLSCPQSLTAKPQGYDPQGGEAFAPGLLAAQG